MGGELGRIQQGVKFAAVSTDLVQEVKSLRSTVLQRPEVTTHSGELSTTAAHISCSVNIGLDDAWTKMFPSTRMRHDNTSMLVSRIQPPGC